MAHSESHTTIQMIVSKIFENIDKLDFGGDDRSIAIFKIKSREGELVELKKTITIKPDPVDKWMVSLENQMQETIFKMLKDGMKTFYMNEDDPEYKINWFKTTMSQVVMVVSQIHWSMLTNYMLEQLEEDVNSLFNWYEGMSKNLNLLVDLVRSGMEIIAHKTIVATITSEVHNKDIVERLINEGVTSPADFTWQQQLRYHYDENSVDKDTCIKIVQIQANMKYGYEYIGPTSRIVVTGLTDRCWITITNALHLKLGAAPAGPAGTGKTESTKDLAKALGRYCVVFNCSEQNDYLIMERQFKGLISVGCWICLDEFNRINIEVLSVVAQQLLELRNALLNPNISSGDPFMFCGEQIILTATCGVFTTMNPGYAGRTELPDNLKALFRPVAMMIPDYAAIAEIKLMSEGFGDSRNLAQKLARSYKLASEQLSQQKHYDFGMRAVNSVLEMAGKLKRAEPEEKEDVLLIRAMKDANVPKFLRDDLPLFNAIIQDLFPEVELPNTTNDEIEQAIDVCLKRRCLQATKETKLKVIQLFLTTNVRFGSMVVGEAMCGKSVVLNC